MARIEDEDIFGPAIALLQEFQGWQESAWALEIQLLKEISEGVKSPSSLVLPERENRSGRIQDEFLVSALGFTLERKLRDVLRMTVWGWQGEETLKNWKKLDRTRKIQCLREVEKTVTGRYQKVMEHVLPCT